MRSANKPGSGSQFHGNADPLSSLRQQDEKRTEGTLPDSWQSAMEFECEGNSIICTPETADALRKQLEVDPACISMGKFSVIVRAREFVERAKGAAVTQHYPFSAGLVRYFDPATFHRQFQLADIPFMKANKFRHQSEYRIVIHTAKHGDDPLRLSIGNPSDIGAKMSSSALATAFQLRFEPDQVCY